MVVYRDAETGRFVSYENAAEDFSAVKTEVVTYEWETREKDREGELDELDDIDYGDDSDIDYGEMDYYDTDEGEY